VFSVYCIGMLQKKRHIQGVFILLFWHATTKNTYTGCFQLIVLACYNKKDIYKVFSVYCIGMLQQKDIYRMFSLISFHEITDRLCRYMLFYSHNNEVKLHFTIFTSFVCSWLKRQNFITAWSCSLPCSITLTQQFSFLSLARTYKALFCVASPRVAMFHMSQLLEDNNCDGAVCSWTHTTSHSTTYSFTKGCSCVNLCALGPISLVPFWSPFYFIIILSVIRQQMTATHMRISLTVFNLLTSR
jgi:hypothetical protein